MPKSFRVLCAAALTFVLSACATSPSPTSWLSADTGIVPAVELADETGLPSLAQQMERHGVPGISIAIVENDEIVALEAYGVKDVSSGEPITPDTVLQAASISKPVSAIGVMTLADTGRIDLDNPADDYLASWKIPSSEHTANDPVTVRELLSHSAGVSVPSYPGFERGADLPDMAQILAGAPEAYSAPVVVSAPQGSYAYSGGGYMVLQQLIEDVAEEPFEAFMRRSVFEPANMTQSTFAIKNEPGGLALGHDWQGARRADPWQDYPQAAAAGLWSTPRDLARLMIAYGKAFKGGGSKLLSEDAARTMAVRIAGDMGIGFGVNGADAGMHLSHAGWTIGFRSHLLYFPETGSGVVIMTNADGGHHLISDVVRTLGRERGWAGFGENLRVSRAAWGESRLSQFTGTYRMAPAGFPLEISRDGEDLRLATPRGSTYSLVPTAADQLVIRESGDMVQFDEAAQEIRLWGMVGSKTDNTGAVQ